MCVAAWSSVVMEYQRVWSTPLWRTTFAFTIFSGVARVSSFSPERCRCGVELATIRSRVTDSIQNAFDTVRYVSDREEARSRPMHDVERKVDGKAKITIKSVRLALVS